MKILAFGASNHSASINAELVRFVAERLTAEIAPNSSTEIVDLNDFEMPIYSIDRQRENGVHPLAKKLFAKIGAADALIISFPEYNGSYTSAWKNIYDWMSRIDMKVYQGKPLLALAATPGPRAGAGVLQMVENSAPFFGADLRGIIGVDVWGEAYDPKAGALTRDDDIAAIDTALKNLVQTEI